MSESPRVKSVIALSCLAIFASIFSISCTDSTAPIARNGVLDLRSWDFEKNGQAKMTGEWAFYWKTFLSPDASPSTYPAPSSFINVPESWGGLSINGKTIPAFGHATYRLIVLLPEDIDEKHLLALRIRNIGTSFELFVNGKWTAGSGLPSADRDSSAPGRFPLTTALPPDGSRLEIVIHAANFQRWEGGIWDDIVIGTENEIRHTQIVSHSYEIFILSSFVIMAFYQLILWLFRRKDRVVLNFAIFCLLIPVRIITTDFKYGINLLPFLPWQLVHDVKYISFFLVFAVFIVYIRGMFPDIFSRIIVKITVTAAVIASVCVVFLPLAIYFRVLQIYQLITFGFGSYVIFTLIRGIYRKIEGARSVTIGVIALFITLVNDVLYSARIISTTYIFVWGMLVFIFVQAWMLARRSHRLFIKVEQQSAEQRQLIKERTEAHRKFTISRLGTILGLAKLAEYRDEDTGFHLERMREYSRVLAASLMDGTEYKEHVNQEYVNDIYHSAILHDIGKVWVKDSILLKPGRLNEEEFAHIQEHTTKGGNIIRDIEHQIGTPTYLELGREIAYSHHEKWDGSGYPQGLQGEDIPLCARIVAVADVYDALTSKRPYKKAFSHEKAVSIISEGRGSHFDPALVDAFLKINSEFDRIRRELGARESVNLAISECPPVPEQSPLSD